MLPGGSQSAFSAAPWCSFPTPHSRHQRGGFCDHRALVNASNANRATCVIGKRQSRMFALQKHLCHSPLHLLQSHNCLRLFSIGSVPELAPVRTRVFSHPKIFICVHDDAPAHRTNSNVAERFEKLSVKISNNHQSSRLVLLHQKNKISLSLCCSL